MIFLLKYSKLSNQLKKIKKKIRKRVMRITKKKRMDTSKYYGKVYSKIDDRKYILTFNIP